MTEEEEVEDPDDLEAGNQTPDAAEHLQHGSSGMVPDAFRRQCDALFEQIDKNSDGQLTKRELKKGLDAFRSSTGLTQTAKQLFKAVDIDGSKKLDADEFHQFLHDALPEAVRAANESPSEPRAIRRASRLPIRWQTHPKMMSKESPTSAIKMQSRVARARPRRAWSVRRRCASTS